MIENIDVSGKLYSNKTAKQLKNITRRNGLKTGIGQIDKDFGFPTGFYVIIGNPGTGKGWLSLWLSRMFWNLNQKTSVFFSLEMPEHLVRERILQAWSDLTHEQYLFKGDTNPAIKMLGEDMFITETFYEEDQKKQTPANFELLVDEYYALGYRIFHFDHLHELDGANDNFRNQQVTEEWANTFQRIAKKYSDIWLLIYAQPNGAAASKTILRRTDIAGSKAITQKCDFCFSINRPVKEDENGMITVDNDTKEVFLYLDKTRYTPKSHVAFKLIFEPTGNYSDGSSKFFPEG